MYGEQGEHKHVFEYRRRRIPEHLVITVPHKKAWGTENPSESPGNTGRSPRSPVPPIFFYSHIWAAEQFGRGVGMSLLSGLLDHMEPPALFSKISRPRLIVRWLNRSGPPVEHSTTRSPITHLAPAPPQQRLNGDTRATNTWATSWSAVPVTPPPVAIARQAPTCAPPTTARP